MSNLLLSYSSHDDENDSIDDDSEIESTNTSPDKQHDKLTISIQQSTNSLNEKKKKKKVLCCQGWCLKRIKLLFLSRGEKLGGIRGVFLPTTMNIFGIILFLRLSLIVGQCGIFGGILEMSVGYLVTFLTTLSFSAISTNGLIKGGGAYYMLSRSIGKEIGGGVGIIFFFGATFGSAVPIIGFAESLVQAFPEVFPDTYWFRCLYSSIALFTLFVIILLGAQTFADSNGLIFIILIVSLFFSIFSFTFQSKDHVDGFTSWNFRTFVGNFKPSFGPDPEGKILNPYKIFGIMFPACYGIMAGINLSGDLKDPKRDIPRGTLCSLGFTYVVYILFMIIMSLTTMKEALISDYQLTARVSFLPILVSIGIFASSLSASLTNMIGASRVLQAVGKDRLLPWISVFGKGFGKNDEPVYAVIFTWFLVQSLIIITTVIKGDLNVIAPYATQFHIIAYAFTNFACFILSVSGAPNFRPLFKYFSWHTALVGVICCIITMMLCDTISAVVSTVVLGCIMIIIYYYAGNVKIGIFRDYLDQIEREHSSWISFITKTKIKAFPEIAVADSIQKGVQQLMMIGGIGAMKPNAIVLDFWEKRKSYKESVFLKSLTDIPDMKEANKYTLDLQEYVNIIKDGCDYKKNVIVTKGFHTLDTSLLVPKNIVKKLIGLKERFIDLWIFPEHDFENNSVILTLQLGYIINQVKIWSKYHLLRVFRIVKSDHEIFNEKARVKKALEDYRITAESGIISMQQTNHNDSLSNIERLSIINGFIRKFSGDNNNLTSFIFTTLHEPPTDPRDFENYWEEVKVLTNNLPPIMLIFGNENVISLEL